MKPNDDSGKLSISERPFRVLIISGSDRRQYNCPGVDSKSRALMLRMAERLPQDWEIDYEDLGNVYGRARIQSCNACVSTSMALCCWPCNCYEKDDKIEPDLMWDVDMYARLDLADAWAIIGPHNWYGASSNLKLMFDRLVCMNGGNPKEELIDHKNPEKAMALEHAADWEELSVNHLEGRTAGFFCYGDEGADEMDETGRPKKLRHKAWFNPDEEPFENARDAYAPLVWQSRYSGIEVPDDLWTYCTTGKGRHYSDNQSEDMIAEAEFMRAFDTWTDRFAAFVGAKGKVEPGRWRAYGYEAPGHRWADAKLAWRGLRMRVGHAPRGSSPRAQEELGLNEDAVLNRHKSEGERLRE
ncbi:MAG: flavodoxin family protein [Gemmatimonadaceae bacterium]|nr:flavodoxin family protein [Gemmatimonadaceae bacterium]NUO94197.1 flavodoxin family protein [Gemmatimonadaceae bacterium]NUP56935.1 flavodoxin family protein [Gemmatimonadaceae bacterium]NUR35966.1 flavodoxin family protein [Gemmatimonadaceae bacterium]NUS34252.1 flavodoxin family protein [Gemmatimonadaceae bacterium]